MAVEQADSGNSDHRRDGQADRDEDEVGEHEPRHQADSYGASDQGNGQPSMSAAGAMQPGASHHLPPLQQQGQWQFFGLQPQQVQRSNARRTVLRILMVITSSLRIRGLFFSN